MRVLKDAPTIYSPKGFSKIRTASRLKRDLAKLKSRHHPREPGFDCRTGVSTQVSPRWAFQVAATQLINVPGHELIPIRESGLLHMPFYEIPLAQVHTFKGKAALEDLLPRGLLEFLVLDDSVRIFVDPFDALRTQIAIQAGWDRQHQTMARTSSLSTLSVSPEDVDVGYFDVKTDREAHRRDRGLTYFHMSEPSLQELVRRSEVLAQRVQEHSQERVGLYPEPVAFFAEEQNTKFIQIVRLRDAVGGIQAKDPTVVPVHSILGDLRDGAPTLNLIDRYAQKSKLSRQSWLEAFSLRLGEYVGQSLINLGIIAQIHGQNLMVEIDEKTGLVTRFILKDLYDVQLDPLACLFKPESSQLAALPELTYLSYFKSIQMEYCPEEDVYITRPNPNHTKMYEALTDGILSHLERLTGPSVLHLFLMGVRSSVGLSADFGFETFNIQSLIKEVERIRFSQIQLKFFQSGLALSPRADMDQINRAAEQSGQLLMMGRLADESGVNHYSDIWNEINLPDLIINSWARKNIQPLFEKQIEIKYWDGKLVFYDRNTSAVCAVFVPDQD